MVTRHIPKRSHAKVRRFHDEGFSISELAVMYHTLESYVEAVLDEDS